MYTSFSSIARHSNFWFFPWLRIYFRLRRCNARFKLVASKHEWLFALA